MLLRYVTRSTFSICATDSASGYLKCVAYWTEVSYYFSTFSNVSVARGEPFILKNSK